ncbi:hypothetical protein STEG23_009257 [Scotinomys teguina]
MQTKMRFVVIDTEFNTAGKGECDDVSAASDPLRGKLRPFPHCVTGVPDLLFLALAFQRATTPDYIKEFAAAEILGQLLSDAATRHCSTWARAQHGKVLLPYTLTSPSCTVYYVTNVALTSTDKRERERF